MIRTRDLAIFIGVFLLLLTGIAITLLLDGGRGGDGRTSPVFNEGSERGGVETPSATLDRESFIADMQERIGVVDEIVIPEDPNQPAEEAEDDDEVTSETTPLICASSPAHSLFAAWPQSDVQIRFVEGVRQVSVLTNEAPPQTPRVASSSASSSLPTSPPNPVRTERVVLELPVLTKRLSEERCAPPGVIGVRADGALMRNTDIAIYQNRLETELIGYALDGFPIYGPTSSGTDRCGGREVNGLYRYQVGKSGEYLINCLAGPPAGFIE